MSDLELENKKLRVLVAGLYSGSNLYSDDGELQDNSKHPHIDFKRDSVGEIKRKMRERFNHEWHKSND